MTIFLTLFFRNDWLRYLILHAALAVVRHFILKMLRFEIS